MKENKCDIFFKCYDRESTKCVYFKSNEDAPLICEYMGIAFGNCNSSIAIVNKMKNELQRMEVKQ